MSTTYCFHPAINAALCLECLMDRGYELYRRSDDGESSPVGLHEALTLSQVALKDDLLGRPNWLWAGLASYDGVPRLIGLTRYNTNAAGPTLDLIRRHAGPRLYYLVEGCGPDDLVIAHVSTDHGRCDIAYWRIAPALNFPQAFPCGSLDDELEGRVYPATEDAVARYRAEKRAWIEPILRPEDYLVADLETRRVAPPNASEWARIHDEEIARDIGWVYCLVYLEGTSSVVPLGECPLEWQRDEHDQLIERFRADAAERSSQFRAIMDGIRREAEAGAAGEVGS